MPNVSTTFTESEKAQIKKIGGVLFCCHLAGQAELLETATYYIV
jgi:hypothetical protein